MDEENREEFLSIVNEEHELLMESARHMHPSLIAFAIADKGLQAAAYMGVLLEYGYLMSLFGKQSSAEQTAQTGTNNYYFHSISFEALLIPS